MSDTFDYEGQDKGGITNGDAPSVFDESAIIAGLKKHLPQQQVEQASVEVPYRVEEASQRAQATVEQNGMSNRVNQFSASIQEDQGQAIEARDARRREEGADLLGSLQTGTVRLGKQIYNVPSTTDLYRRLTSLTPEEVEAVNEVRTYEATVGTLNKKMAEVVNNTELDPFKRELIRGTLQEQLNRLERPEAAYNVFEAKRAVQTAGENFGLKEILEQQNIDYGTRPETLREFVEGIDVEYKDLQENDEFFKQYEADTDNIYKEDFAVENKQRTKEGLEQVTRGSEAFDSGDYVNGTMDIVSGSIDALGGSIVSALNNPEGVAEIITESAPQMASAFIPYVNLLTNTAYVSDVYKEAVQEYEKENPNQVPTRDEVQRMAVAAIGAGLLEVAADKILVGGTGKVIDSVPQSVKTVIDAAKNNRYVSNSVTRIASRGATSAVTEGATEAGQTALEEVAKGNEVDGAEVSAAAVIGAAAGASAAGTAQAVKEGKDVASQATETVKSTAKKAAEKIAPTSEEVVARNAEKTVKRLRDGKRATSEQKADVTQAKQSLAKAEALLATMRNLPGVDEANIRAMEKKVEKLKNAAPQLATLKPDTKVVDNAPEDMTADEYLEEVSFQMSLDNDGEFDEKRLQKALDTAVSKGANDAQVKQIERVLAAVKSSNDVSSDITIGNDEWRGGGTYINNIIQAVNVGNEAGAAYNLSELERFTDYMVAKREDYSKAHEEAKRLGRSVPVIDTTLSEQAGEEVFYFQLDGKVAYATPNKDTASLVDTINRDTQILEGIRNDGQAIYNAGGYNGSSADVLAQYLPTNETPTADTEEEPQVSPEDSETFEPTEIGEAEEEVRKANTEKVAQDLEPVKQALNTVSADEVEARPDASDVINRAVGGTQSTNVKRAIRELGKQINYKNEFGTVIDPLDSSIPEAYYERALEAIKQAMADPEFGKQVVKNVGQQQIEGLVESYGEQGRTEKMSDADVAFLTTNEFREEAKAEGFIADEGLSGASVLSRAKKVGVTPEQAASIMRMVKVGYGPIMAKVTARFNRTIAKASKKNEVFMKPNSRWLSNFMDESGGMSKFIRTGAGLAAIDWLLNNTGPVATTSAIQAFGNLDSKAEVPERLFALVGKLGGVGDTKQRIIQSLGETALKVSGVKFSGKRGNTEARHQAALGALLFDALNDMGVFNVGRVSVNRLVWAGADYDNTATIEQFDAVKLDEWPKGFKGKYIAYNEVVYEWTGRNYKVYDDTQSKYIATYTVNPDALVGDLSVKQFQRKAKGLLNPYSKLFGTDRDKRVPAMMVPRKNAGKIKGYPNKRLNETQLEAQNKQSEQALYLNKDMIRWFYEFGEDALLRVSGYKNVPENTNKVLRLSQEGKNQTILADFRGLETFINDMEAEGVVAGIDDFTDIPFYANFSNSAYQRQFVDSQTFNYQSSKSMHRFMAHHKPVTVKVAGFDDRLMKLGVAQGIGIGVDKLDMDSSLAQLKEWREENDLIMNAAKAFVRKQDSIDMDAVIEFAASEEGTHTLLAVIELAKLEVAREDKWENLEITIPVELDGVNNGPITAILQSITSSSDYESALKQAGITYADKDTRTHGQRAEEGLNGLYEDGAEAFQESLSATRKDIEPGSVTATLLNAQIGLKALNSKLVGLKGSVEIKRNETKGIITKMFYSAGKNSLLRGEADDLVKNFYTELQRNIDGKEDANLSILVNRMVRASTPVMKNKREMVPQQEWMRTVRANVDKMMMDLATQEAKVNYSLPEEVIQGLVKNMQYEYSYGSIKLQAISDIYYDAINQAKLLTRLTSVAAVFAKGVYDRARSVKEQEDGLSQYETLSRKRENELIKEVEPTLPNLSLDMHTAEDKSDAIPLYKFDKAPTDRAAIKAYSLDMNRSTVFTAGKELTDIGAGAGPASTISVADASVIMGIMEQMNQGFMTVFDGVLINAQDMDVLAQAANLAYFKSLKNNNTFAQALAGVTPILANADVSTLSNKELDSLLPRDSVAKTRLDKEIDVSNMVYKLVEQAEGVSAGIRKNEALGNKDLSVDQFGSLNNKTTIVTPEGKATDAVDALSALNQKGIEELYEDTTVEVPEEQIYVRQTNSPSLDGFITRNWGTESVFNSKGGKQRLLNLVKQAGVPESEYADFLREGLIDKVLAPAFSAIGSLPAIKIVNDEDMRAAVGNYKAKGAFVHGENTIYLNRDLNGVNQETLFHELTHAALDVSLRKESRTNAEFAQDVDAMAREAAEYLQKNSSLITRFTANGSKTDIVNGRIPWMNGDRVNSREFLTWGLTNYAVIVQLMQAKSETKPTWLGKFFLMVQSLVQKLFGKKYHVQEDSIFNFLFATSVKLAEGAERPRTRSTTKSLQQEYAAINKADAETTFNAIAGLSVVSEATTDRLHSVFTQDILPVLNELDTDMSSSVNNTVEVLDKLALEDVDVNPNMMVYKFNMSPIEIHTYELLQKVLAAGIDDFNMNTRELVKLYNNARKNLKPEDFLNGEPNTPDNMIIAQSKYDAIFSDFGAHSKVEFNTTSAGIKVRRERSNYLANFAAMARTSEEFRQVLEKRYNPERRNTGTNVNDLEIWAINTMSAVTEKIVDSALATGTKGRTTIGQRADKLAMNIAATEVRSKGFLERKARDNYEKLGKAYNAYARFFDRVYQGILGSDTAGAVTEFFKNTFSNTWSRFKDTDIGYNAFYHLHKGYAQFLPRMMEEVAPTMDSNKAIRRLTITKTKAIAGARDGIIKAAHRALADLLPNMNKVQSKAMTKVMLDTDFATLVKDNLFYDPAALLTSETKRSDARKEMEAKIMQLGGDYKHLMIRAAYSLGTLMATGKPSEEFTYPNAKAIAAAAGDAAANNTELVQLIDNLASLAALEHSSDADRKLVHELYRKNPANMQKLVLMIDRHKKAVVEQQYDGNAYRVLKGHFFDAYDGFKDIRFVTKDTFHDYVGSNYYLHRVIEKDTSDGNPQDVYIVASKTGGLGTYQQGQYSTINSRLGGINNLDGRLTGSGFDDYATQMKYSKITRSRKAKALQDMMKPKAGSLTPKDYMVPEFGANGTSVTGFKYTVSRAESEQLLGRDNDFITNLSSAMGRVVEANHSDSFNVQVNKALKETYDYDLARGADMSSYVEISNDAPTERGREAYRMMPPAAREHMKSIWGDKVYVRSSMMDMVYGYRKASLSNVFRKNADNPNWVKKVAKVVTANYRYEGQVVSGIRRTEKFLEEISGFIKDAIVIRGMTVMIGNMLSNTVQLTLQNDMPVLKAIKYQVEGMRNAKAYQVAQSQVRRLELQLSAIEGLIGYKREERRIVARLAELREELARNPAAPLIEEGLLTAIVEDVEPDNNPFSYLNKVSSWATGMASNLPKSVRWVGDLALANRDTEVYKTLYMYTQLGDFSSRYALYKDIEEKNGKVTPEDIDGIVDAFVNYDLPSNKYLQYLGDVGQLWFFKYFFRIQNVIIRNTIRNPRRVLDLVLLSNITGLNMSTYFDAFFLFNAITNKLGFVNYAEMGMESLPAVQVYDFVAP